jgi:mRNA-degrading endonuclease YafQ of YafQ-DinJ toxin-antitoxin module
MTSKKTAASKRLAFPVRDFLLIYKLKEETRHGLVVFVRSGTHSELFR